MSTHPAEGDTMDRVRKSKGASRRVVCFLEMMEANRLS